MIYRNGKYYGSSNVINYTAAPDYNRKITVDNITSGEWKAEDNGFLIITVKCEQSNPSKVSVKRSLTPVNLEGEEIYSTIIQQFQFSETMQVPVLAGDYYKCFFEGNGEPRIVSCSFIPYSSNIPIKLTETITKEQIVDRVPLNFEDVENFIVEDHSSKLKIISPEEVLNHNKYLKYIRFADAKITIDIEPEEPWSCNQIDNPGIYCDIDLNIYDIPTDLDALQNDLLKYLIVRKNITKTGQILIEQWFAGDLVGGTTYYYRYVENPIKDEMLQITNFSPWIKRQIDLNKDTSGVLRIEQGGTGTQNGYRFQNSYTMDELRALLGLEQRAYTSQELFDILNTKYRLTGLVFTIPFVLQSFISDLPDNSGGMLQFIGANNDSARMYYYYPHNSAIYVNQSVGQRAQGWTAYNSNYYGMRLDRSNGFTWSGRQFYVHMYTHDQILNNSMGLKVGDMLVANSSNVNLNGADSDTVWYFNTKFPQGGTYYYFFYQFLPRHNNKCIRIWQGKIGGGQIIRDNSNKDSFFMGYIQKIG